MADQTPVTDEIFPQHSGKTYSLVELMPGESPLVGKGPDDTVFSFPIVLLVGDRVAARRDVVHLPVLADQASAARNDRESARHDRSGESARGTSWACRNCWSTCIRWSRAS